MRLCSISSGSDGNCIYVGGGDANILVDAGISGKKIEAGLSGIDVDPAKIDAGAEVKLAITYKATGFDTMEYLLINGSYQEYYWPYSGTSKQDANYVIITMVN